MIDLGNEIGPEHIAIGKDGKLYAAMLSGNLIRMDQDGRNHEVFANTGGRVLGFDFDAQGRMIAADAMKGLLAIGADRARHRADRSRQRRRSDRLCQRRRRGAGRHDLFHTVIHALLARAMGRHL